MQQKKMRYRMRKLLGITLAAATMMGSLPSAVYAEETPVTRSVQTEATAETQAKATEETQKQTGQGKTPETESAAGEQDALPEETVPQQETTAKDDSGENVSGATTSEESSGDSASNGTSENETAKEQLTESPKQEESETAQEAGSEETETDTGIPETETARETEHAVAVQSAKDSFASAAGNGTYDGTAVAEDTYFVPGTYQLTANLYIPGDGNTYVPDVTLYLSSTASNQTTPVTSNATLTVGADGRTKTLTVPVQNASFPLQQITNGETAAVKQSAWDRRTYQNAAGQSVSGRITELTFTLNGNAGKYTLGAATLFPTSETSEWQVPLALGVDLASVPQLKKQQITSGDGQSWQQGSAEGLVFISEAASDSLQAVLVDGQFLTEGQYTRITQGTTGLYIQLSAEYLSTLAPGSHSILIRSTEGIAQGAFTVAEAADGGEKDANESAGEALAAGTYQITANLYLPGELNTQLPGTTAYLTNPANPLGIGGYDGIPMTPVSDNATLVVGADGKKTVIVDVVNPVFTLQKITSGDTITVLGAVRDSEVYTGVSQMASRTGRITKLYLEIKDHKGVYQFGDCTEFPTLLETDWNVPLQLSVDFTSARKISDSTDTGLPSDAGNGSGNGQAETETEPQTETETESEKKNNTKDTDPNSGTGTLKPGTYTVAANIWIDKASSGLPLNPHLTSSVFPPKDPVSNNAQVTIDKDGRATVRVPIVIQSKVMSVKSISGLNLISSSSSGGYLTGITVDLGKVTNPDAVITKSCTVSLDLGELAQTIAKKGREQVWGATFQVNFSGVPSGGSGGGNVDVNSLIADASGSTTTVATGTNIRIGVREDAALAALLPMMASHKDDKEIQAQTTTIQSSTATGSNTATGTQNMAGATTTQASVKNSYLFTVERLTDTEATAGLTDEEQQEALFTQYQKHFTDGTYDLILVSPEEAEKLQKEEGRGTFEILALIEYAEKDESSAAADAQSESDAAQMLLVSKHFLEQHEATATDILKEVQDSVSEANANPEQTAVSLVTLGIGSDSAATQELLKNHTANVISGKELRETVNVLAEDKAYAGLKDKSLCYVSATAENSSATTEVTESETEQATEKIEITDEDSLSAALDAALAKKKQDSASDTEDGAADAQTNSTSVTVSNSSGLDPAAEQSAAEALTPGTYTVSANLYLPGERNTQLPGTTAYMTNPDNPLGIGGHDGIPMTPVADNATLVVAEDGTKTVTLDIVNPVFTLQKIAEPENSAILEAARDEERYEGTNGVGVDGRITKLAIRLGDDTALYPFDDCAEFPTLLETDWYVPLELSVEFTTAQKVSDSTEVDLTEATTEAATDTQQ